MDLDFFKKCLAKGMTKEEALEFALASGEQEPKTQRTPRASRATTTPTPAAAPKAKRAYGSFSEALEAVKGSKGTVFTTADLLEAASKAGSLFPQGYADQWARAQIESKKIARVSRGHYKTL